MTTYRKAPIATCALLAALFAVVNAAAAQEAPRRQIDAPAEPNAIPLNTGGVEGQTTNETWYEQWGDPFVRNVSRATLTPFLPERKAKGAAVIVAPGGAFSNPLDGQRGMGSGSGPQ